MLASLISVFQLSCLSVTLVFYIWYMLICTYMHQNSTGSPQRKAYLYQNGLIFQSLHATPVSFLYLGKRARCWLHTMSPSQKWDLRQGTVMEHRATRVASLSTEGSCRTGVCRMSCGCMTCGRGAGPWDVRLVRSDHPHLLGTQSL